MVAHPIYLGKKLMGLEGPSGQRYGLHEVKALGPSSCFRLLFISMVEWPWFDRLSLLAVSSNCIFLALEGPPGSAPSSSDTADLVFTLIFTVELVIKVLAMGFVIDPYSYIRSAWNQLDLLVVVASWLPLLFPALDNFTAMRAFRALRPLRTINRMPGLRRQVDTLLDSLPHLLDVSLLSGFIMVVFGVLSLQLFQGLLRYRCYEPDTTEPIDPLYGVCGRPDISEDGMRGTCDVGQQCNWFGENPAYGTISFDNIFEAWLTVFQCITLEGWIDATYMVKDASGWLSTFFFISVVSFGSFYVLNLFLAVMWHTYEKQPMNQGASSDEVITRRFSSASSERSGSSVSFLHASRSSLRLGVFQVVSSTPFNAVGFLVILVNVFLMTLESHPIDPTLARLLEQSNLVITTLFTLEMALKLFAFGLAGYWEDAYNRFDGFIVVASLV